MKNTVHNHTQNTDAQSTPDGFEKPVLLMVHGCNVDGPAIIDGYRKILNGLERQNLSGYDSECYGGQIGFAWEGRSGLHSFARAGSRADREAIYLRELLIQLNEESIVADICAHSLGARVALEALRLEGVHIRNLILLGPAVANDSLDEGGIYTQSVANCASVNIFYSQSDKILKYGHRVFDLPACRHALGTTGTQSPNAGVRQIDCSKFVLTHSEYRTAPRVYTHWREIVMQSETSLKKAA